jgi:hypothetical protein
MKQPAKEQSREHPMTWWSLGKEAGVLALDDGRLELHWRLVDGTSVAWWTDELGRWLRLVTVGLA